MGEMDLRGGVGVGKNQVSHNMSLAIQSLATQLCWGFVGLFLVSDGGPGAPGCLNQGAMGWVRYIEEDG